MLPAFPASSSSSVGAWATIPSFPTSLQLQQLSTVNLFASIFSCASSWKETQKEIDDSD
ncbi:hypothetical protein CCACVL1_22955 [Corchorus capsularis]|uniref:Uncharacterized protein n=1 Tax=Corchorus capsularis TaxID=210143 RepID=A0A1R3GW31_COCAP|nr:hypothetical protein CCACVL1_22955 [Corchorus capsularis]